MLMYENCSIHLLLLLFSMLSLRCRIRAPKIDVPISGQPTIEIRLTLVIVDDDVKVHLNVADELNSFLFCVFAVVKLDFTFLGGRSQTAGHRENLQSSN